MRGRSPPGRVRGEKGEGQHMTLRAVEVAVALFQEYTPSPGQECPRGSPGRGDRVNPGVSGRERVRKSCPGLPRGRSPREGGTRRDGRVPGQELRAEPALRGRCVVLGVCVCGPAEPRSSVQRLLTAC